MQLTTVVPPNKHPPTQRTSRKVLHRVLDVSRWRAADYADQARVAMNRQLQENAL